MTTLISWQLSNTPWITVVASPWSSLPLSLPLQFTLHTAARSILLKQNLIMTLLHSKFSNDFLSHLESKWKFLPVTKKLLCDLASSVSPRLAHSTPHMDFAHDFPLPGMFFPQTCARLTLSLPLVASQILSYQRDLS